jgi:hypothetical protein
MAAFQKDKIEAERSPQTDSKVHTVISMIFSRTKQVIRSVYIQEVDKCHPLTDEKNRKPISQGGMTSHLYMCPNLPSGVRNSYPIHMTNASTSSRTPETSWDHCIALNVSDLVIYIRSKCM